MRILVYKVGDSCSLYADIFNWYKIRTNHKIIIVRAGACYKRIRAHCGVSSIVECMEFGLRLIVWSIN